MPVAVMLSALDEDFTTQIDGSAAAAAAAAAEAVAVVVGPSSLGVSTARARAAPEASAKRGEGIDAPGYERQTGRRGNFEAGQRRTCQQRTQA